MDYTGVITDINIFPTANMVSSIIRLTIELDPDKNDIVLEEKGTNEDLSKKFGFNIEGDVYYLHPLKGRKCNVSKDKDGYHFVSYIN